jgi:prepilin-type processing-associated H-X9-DG protein
MGCRVHPKQGLTLVELLLMITVLLGLTAMLMPALSNALEKGRQAHCKSNLRQMGTTVALIGGGTGYLLPAASYEANAKCLTGHYVFVPAGGCWWHWYAILDRWMGFQPVYRRWQGNDLMCPSYPVRRYDPSVDCYRWSYVINNDARWPRWGNCAVWVTDVHADYPRRYGEAPDAILIGDGDPYPDPSHHGGYYYFWSTPDPGYGYLDRLDFRHDGACDFLHVDGHVTSRRQHELNNDLFDMD